MERFTMRATPETLTGVSVTMSPTVVKEITCESDTECVWNPESDELRNYSDCQPQEITDGRLGFAINSSLVIIVGILGNLLTLIAIPYVRIR